MVQLEFRSGDQIPKVREGKESSEPREGEMDVGNWACAPAKCFQRSQLYHLLIFLTLRFQMLFVMSKCGAQFLFQSSRFLGRAFLQNVRRHGTSHKIVKYDQRHNYE